MSMYCKINTINGNVTAKGFENQIELKSFHIGAARAVSMDTGNGCNRDIGATQFFPAEIIKPVDNATTHFFDAITKRESLPQVIITKTKTDSSLSPIVQYTLHDVHIVSTQTIMDDDDEHPFETIKLAYQALETKVFATGKASSPMSSGYKIAEAEKM